MVLSLGVLQVPVLLAAEDLGDAAGEDHLQIGEQGAGDRTHPWDADPAWLLVRGGAQLAVAVLVESGFPLVHPAFLAPVLQGVEEAPVAGGEVLRAEVQRAGLAALAGHAAAAAVALVEQLYGLAGGSQCVGGGKPGDASTDDGDGDAHDMPLWLCSVWTGESGFLYKLDLMYSIARASRRTLHRADGALAAHGSLPGLSNLQTFRSEVSTELSEE